MWVLFETQVAFGIYVRAIDYQRLTVFEALRDVEIATITHPPTIFFKLIYHVLRLIIVWRAGVPNLIVYCRLKLACYGREYAPSAR